VLTRVFLKAVDQGVETDIVRVADYKVHPDVSSKWGDGDKWPGLRERILAAEIVIIVTPTWLGQTFSTAKRVLERMDAVLPETDDQNRPVAWDHVSDV
jgi:multimeric flavodoxin WrbA